MTAVRVTWEELPGEPRYNGETWLGKTGWTKVWEQPDSACRDMTLCLYDANHDRDETIGLGSCLVELVEWQETLALFLCDGFLEAADVVKRLSVFSGLDRPHPVCLVDEEGIAR